MQYVGETGQKIKERMTNYRYDIKHHLSTLVAKHFNGEGHCWQDLQCTPIEQIRSSNIAVRKRREKYWRYQLRTHFPDGLNVWDSVEK